MPYPEDDLDAMLAYAPPAGTYDPATFGPTPVNFPDVPAPESAPVSTTAPPAAPSRTGRVVNPGNWVYAGSRLPGEAPVRFPDQPPDVETGYGINRFDLPGGVAAYHVSQDYQDRQRQLEQQAAAARQARDQAVRDAQMLDQMMRVSRSMKDIEVARQQIDMQGLQRDLSALGPTASPVDQARIIARHPISASHLGAGYAAALKAQVPPGQTSYIPPNGGAPGYVVDPRGVPHFPPGMEPRMETPKEEDLGGGVRGVRISPQHFQITTRPGGKLPVEDAQEVAWRNADIKAAMARKADLIKQGTRVDAPDIVKLDQAISENQNTVRNLIKAAGSKNTAPIAPASGAPPTPRTKSERDALPAGTRYVGPDGRTYIKK